MKKCCFIGHRDCMGIEKEIEKAIQNLLKNHELEFYSGGMGNFDRMCESIVRNLERKITFVPYNYKQIKTPDRLWYDNIICPFQEKPYSKFDIPNRNKWMVDNCDVCICYVHKDGSAKHTLDYAIKKGKQIINIKA